MSFILNIKCDLCKTTRFGTEVFVECMCTRKRIYGAEVEKQIAEDLKMMNDLMSSCDEHRTPPADWIGKFILARLSLGEHTKKLIADKNEYQMYQICEKVEGIRSIDRYDFSKRNLGCDVSVYDLLAYMTPEIARCIRYKKCIYLETAGNPCNANVTGDNVLCAAHFGMFYIVSNELMIAGINGNIMYLCLDYLMLNHQELGCTPGRPIDARPPKRPRIEEVS